MSPRPKAYSRICLLVVLASLAIPALQFAGAAELAAFTTSWNHPGPSKLDLSNLSAAPAGRTGFITVRDGHLTSPDGTRFRLWGVNLTGGACFPEKANAPHVAHYLARLGINTVRLHFLDSPWGAGRSLFDPAATSTRELYAPQLDRLDFLVAELIRAGIYVDFNLNVGRTYREGDSVRDHATLGFGKAATLFSARLIELQRDYARQLLTHRNPYTGRAYHAEPGVVAVEIVNENSLVLAWVNGRLSGTQPPPSPNATWRDLPPSYAAELDEHYNRWSRARLSPDQLQQLAREAGAAPGAPLPRLKPAEFEAASAFRFQHEARFILETERAFYTGMEQWLRRELGLKCVIIANSDHAHHRNDYATLSSLARLSVVDGHVYWSLNDRQVDPATGHPRPPFRGNRSMVSDPEHSMPVQLARSAVEGKPFIVSETNHLVPPFEAEGIPIVSSYAALQDWDGLIFYTFEHEEPGVWDTAVPNTQLLNLAMDPVKIAQLAAFGVMFKRGHLRPATECVVRGYDETQLIEGIRGGSPNGPVFTEGFSSFLPLLHRTRIRSFDQAITSYPAIDNARDFKSDTGQLVWHNRERNFVEIAAPQIESLIGYTGGQTTLLRHCDFKAATDFAALTLVSLDDQPIARASRLLLVTAGKCELTDAQWNDAGWKLLKRGRKPARIEAIRGELTLRGLEHAAQIVVEPLDGAGNPLTTTSVPVRSGTARVTLGTTPTIWYLLTASR